jgi:hypothetical protein
MEASVRAKSRWPVWAQLFCTSCLRWFWAIRYQKGVEFGQCYVCHKQAKS